MHELPKELSHSLRSWRGSVYRNSGQHEPIDLEKLDTNVDDYGEKTTRYTQVSLHSESTESQQHYGRTASRHLDGPPAEDKEPPKAPTTRKATFVPETPVSAKRSIFNTAPKVQDPDPAADRLDDDTTPLSADAFYLLIGMQARNARGERPKHLAAEHGLYSDVHHAYEYINTKYRIFDVLTYALLILQLLLSAVFIVLGSLTSVNSHLAISVLGALSTVVAGSLALMKGQGLPNRLRQLRDSLRDVMFEAEELYCDFGAGRNVYYRDIRKLREDFLRVMEEGRKNHPDTWNASAKDVAAGVKTSGAKTVSGRAAQPATTVKPA